MIRIAKAGNVDVYSDENYFISFMNSPYPSHRELTAVDIFPVSRKTEEVISPVSGKVAEHRIHTMRKNGEKEHVLIIDVGQYFVKILHVFPYVDPGNEIRAGEKLGMLYRSPYFRPWTDPHIHLEIRNKNDFLRARGGLRLNIPRCSIEGNFDLKDTIEIHDSYVLRKIKPLRCGDFYGAGDNGIIDGGYPHYRLGLLLGGESASFLGKKIGDVYKSNGDFIVKFFIDRIVWKEMEFLGIGFNIYLNEDSYIKYIFRNNKDRDIFEAMI